MDKLLRLKEIPEGGLTVKITRKITIELELETCSNDWDDEIEFLHFYNKARTHKGRVNILADYISEGNASDSEDLILEANTYKGSKTKILIEKP